MECHLNEFINPDGLYDAAIGGVDNGPIIGVFSIVDMIIVYKEKIARRTTGAKSFYLLKLI